MNARNPSYVIYILLFIAIIAMLVYNFSDSKNAQVTLSINEVAAAIKKGEVAKIVEDENRLRITYLDGTTTSTSTKDSGATLIEQLL
ncbi:MAG: cell division protein FtsH, partial [Anaerolineaceae bacterium]|nr:cell division protein FtsH [Anaerolineaceae bacterium]